MWMWMSAHCCPVLWRLHISHHQTWYFLRYSYAVALDAGSNNNKKQGLRSPSFTCEVISPFFFCFLKPGIHPRPEVSAVPLAALGFGKTGTRALGSPFIPISRFTFFYNQQFFVFESKSTLSWRWSAIGKRMRLCGLTNRTLWTR
jgi:hypothetical protein